MMKDVGMKECSYENLTDGMVALHSGYKLWSIILCFIYSYIQWFYLLYILFQSQLI